MINEDSIISLSKYSFNIPNTCLPCYGGYSFASIPNTILSLFDIDPDDEILPDLAIAPVNKTAKNVVVILLDAFGWNSFEKYADEFDLIKKFKDNGVISKISSQFPSTTAVNIPTINTGLSVTQHGLLEWFYYDSRVGRPIMPLLNAIVEPRHEINSATSRTGLKINHICPSSCFYQTLDAAGIDSYVCNPSFYKRSKINQSLFTKSNWVDGDNLDMQLNNLLYIINSGKNNKYAFIYEPGYDTCCHQYGFASREAHSFSKDFFSKISDFIGKIKEKNTYIIFTADHGIKDSDAVIFLDDAFPELRNYLKKDASGRLITHSGGPTDWFLYVNKAEEVRDLLNQRLADVATIITKEEAINFGFFGSNDYFSKAFRDNLPDLFILSTSDTSFFWRGEKEGYSQVPHWIGVHGGITKSEMESVFMIMKV